jgi:hypothetical protein
LVGLRCHPERSEGSAFSYRYYSEVSIRFVTRFAAVES